MEMSMEKKRYLIGGVKPSLKRKWINERKDNQSDFKELKEYANPRTPKKSNLLPSKQRCKVIT
tara:strand:- start:793 stop:981 length:189 start_codon:yes stop_codon:yes gene_type:complete